MIGGISCDYTKDEGVNRKPAAEVISGSAIAQEADATATIERREPPTGVKKAKYNRKALARVPSKQLETGRARMACIPRYDSSGAQSSSC